MAGFILVVELGPSAQATLLPLCTLPERRADHVTLAHDIERADAPERWVPGGSSVGSVVRVRAFALHRSARVEALAVEIAGLRTRPHDGAPLHVTLARATDARSHESNALLAAGPGTPVDLWLEGVVGWRPARSGP